jgi:serine/threonine-protein kinase ATR
LQSTSSCSPDAFPFAAEAAWSTGKWDQLEKILTLPSEAAQVSTDFKVGVGKALLSLRQKQTDEFQRIVAGLREGVARALSPTSTASIHASHDSLMKLHVLYELETISGISAGIPQNRDTVLEHLDRRLDILGAFTSDKQYLLGIRRAAMELSRCVWLLHIACNPTDSCPAFSSQTSISPRHG